MANRGTEGEFLFIPSGKVKTAPIRRGDAGPLEARQPVAAAVSYRIQHGADLPEPLSYTTCSDVVNGKIYVFGGRTAPDVLSDGIWVYEIARNRWRKAAGRMPYAYDGRGARTVTHGGIVYLSPGLGPTDNNGWGIHQRIIAFDIAGEIARETASFGAPVWSVSPVMLGNDIYWFGACGLGQERNIWRFNPKTGALSIIASLDGAGKGTTGAVHQQPAATGGDHADVCRR